MMQSKRDYLVSKGLAKPGRGKFSNAGKAALAEAEAAGVKFSDATGPTKAAGPVRATEQTKTPATPSAGVSDYLFPSDFRFPEGEYKAVGTDGKTYGMREVCNNCRVSLVMCACGAPTIHGNMVVHIRERK